MREYLRFLRALPQHVAQLQREVSHSRRDLDALLSAVESMESAWPGLRSELDALRAQAVGSRDDAARMLAVLQLVFDDEPANRRRLYELRGTAEYELAYAESTPLVSVVIPTFDRHETLAKRAIPSVLTQSYSNIEVLVVGEAATAEVGEAVERINDRRLRFYNLNRRGPYPSDVLAAWQATGTAPFNEGVRLARGRWIAPLDDDDAFRPHHVESLLDAARGSRWEVATALQEIHPPDGRPSYLLGEFPPRLSQFNLQATLYHAGLRFMELELATGLFKEPNDWNLCRRWLRAGVRMGLLSTPTVDIYPSWRWDGTDRNRSGSAAGEDSPRTSAE